MYTRKYTVLAWQILVTRETVSRAKNTKDEYGHIKIYIFSYYELIIS